jgi:outer membrane immunogenic protein
MARARLGWALLMAAMALPTAAQTISRLDVSANYVATVANAQPGNCGCFVMNGGGAEAAYHLNRYTAAVADVSIVHTNSVSGANFGLGLATYLFGARYTYSNRTQYLPYVQAEIGEVHGFDSTFPGVTGTTANAFAFTAGGGLELMYRPRISFRVIEANFLRTELPNNVNGSQNNLKLSAGVVFHLW